MSRTIFGYFAGASLFLLAIGALIWAMGGLPQDTTTQAATGIVLFASGLFYGMGMNERMHWRIRHPNRTFFGRRRRHRYSYYDQGD